MKYKVGDKARVRSDLVVDEEYGGWWFDPKMNSKKGVILTVDSIDPGDYYIMDDGSEYWTDEMLEDVEEEFKLPEKWCIKIDDLNCELVGDWFLKNDHQTGINDLNKTCYRNWYFKYPRFNGYTATRDRPHIDYIEITFDQFKKYVLKESESTPKFESKFVKGRWYKNPKWWSSPEDFCKFSGEFSGDLIGYTDKIIKGIPYLGSTGYWCNGDLCIEASAEEIQQYLPENHPDKIKKRTKKVEDLKYPDAVHCSSKEEHYKVKQFANIGDYEGDYYYLLGAQSRREKPWDGTCGKNSESRTTYTNYEFSDIIFPEEKVVDKENEEFKIGAYIVFLSDFGSSKKGDVDKIKTVYSPEQIILEKEGISWGRLGEGFSKECKYFLTLEEAQAFSDELLGKNKVEKEDERLSFYVRYNTSFTEDLYDKLMEWCVKNNSRKIRGFSDSYKGLVESGYFVYDNFGLNNGGSIGYGVDNNRQNCINEYSVQRVKELIGYKEAFDKQGKSGVKEKEELVQTGLSQIKACDSCKYHGKCGTKGFNCNATGGQHYPKDNSSKRYTVTLDPFDAESSSDGIEVGKFPLDRGMGLYEQMSKMIMQTHTQYFSGNLGELPNIKFVGDSDSDEIYVPIIKTEVKQIKL